MRRASSYFMALLVRAAMVASLAALALGQRHAGMPGAFGRGFLPSGGGPPSQPPAGVTRPGFPPSSREHNRGPRESQAPPVVIVPFPVYGSPDAGPLGISGQDAGQPASEAPPPPPVMEPYPEEPYGPPQGIPRWAGRNADENPPTCLSAPPEPPRPPAEEAQPIIYLIALKNQRIVEAFGYWIQDGALHYVSTAYGLNQVSLSLVDRDFSRRLNEERGVKFDLLSN